MVRLVDAQEIVEVLGVSKAAVYKIILKLNAELKEKGCWVIQGRVSRDYFEQKFS